MAELYRLRGQFAEAENAFRQASRLQRTPQPGLAQLRFAQGQLDAANVAIRRILEELLEPAARASALDAYVEIVLAAKDVSAARAAASELAEIAGRFNAPLLFGQDGEPMHERGVVSRAAGMYFVGLHFLYSMTSATLLGIGRDAEHVARAIELRTTESRSQASGLSSRLKLPGALLRSELLGR